MSLTAGRGPFGPRPSGVFNVEMPPPERILYFEESSRRVRVRVAGETLADSQRARLLHEHGSRPVYYFPEADVRLDLLDGSDHVEDSELKGRTVYWDARCGERTAEHAAYAHVEPPAEAGFLLGYVSFACEAVDEWLEEDEHIAAGPRDPYRRIDVLRSSRHVRVALDGHALADTRRALALFESGLAPRWYIPLDDVRTDRLRPSGTRTTCPYKGRASHFDAGVGRRVEADVAWTYVHPLAEAARVKGHLAFLHERVDVELDGDVVSRGAGSR
jgi:uncharacterized protein (DUF427 family)